MIIDFQIIPHKKQRYDTVGDYFKGTWESFTTARRGAEWIFRVSRMRYQKYSILVFLHEIIEFFLCRMAGIKMRDIDKFDMEYENTRCSLPTSQAPCGCLHFTEPGDDSHAPYYQQHICASRCERLIAQCMGVDWDEYAAAIDRLSRKSKKAPAQAA